MVFATNKHMGNPALITEAAMVNKELSGQEMCRRAAVAALLGTCVG